MDNSHNWIFHKNSYTGKWHAVKSDEYFLLKNDLNNPSVLSSSSVDTLIEIINKTNGDPELIKKLTK